MEINNIYGVFRLLNSISKLAGLSLFSETCAEGNRLKKKLNIMVLYSVLLTLFIVLVAIYVMYWIVTEENQDIIDIHLLQMPIIVTTSAIILLVSNLKFISGMNLMLQRVSLIDELLKISDDNYIKNSKLIKKQILIVMIIYGMFSIWEIFMFKRSNSSLAYCGAMSMPVVIHFITALQYINFVYLIRERFKLINRCILSPRITCVNSMRLLYSDLGIIQSIQTDKCLILSSELYTYSLKHLKGGVRNSEVIPSSFENTNKLKLHFQTLRIIQEGMCEVSSLINDMYCFQILLFILTSFTDVTANLYYSIERLTSSSSKDVTSTLRIMLPITWAIFYFMFVFVISWICELASNEGRRTAIVLQKLLLIPNLQPQIVSEIKLFSYQVLIRKVSFTAWNIFTLNLKFLGSIVGSIITLLVILVQYF